MNIINLIKSLYLYMYSMILNEHDSLRLQYQWMNYCCLASLSGMCKTESKIFRVCSCFVLILH